MSFLKKLCAIDINLAYRDENHKHFLFLADQTKNAKIILSLYQWYFKIADLNNCFVQHDLGCIYANGIHIEQNYEKSVYWFLRATEQGFAKSSFNLGVLHQSGLGCTQDPFKTFSYFKFAAEKDYTLAQVNLGIFYAQGKGCMKDLDLAIFWLKKAAGKKHVLAQLNLGFIYEASTYLQDEALALMFFQEAAKQENAEAQYKTAMMYLNGRGCQKDKFLAKIWLQRAIENDYPPAKVALYHLLKFHLFSSALLHFCSR